MNPHLLIDAIVRQTTVLIAQLATAAGTRAPLAHVAADVFGSLVEELKDQGLGSKVIADMFGLALRTYHNLDWMELDGTPVRVLSQPRLIEVKKKLSRPKDQLALLHLQATLEEREKKPGA